MPGRQAKVFTPIELNTLLRAADRTSRPDRDRAIVQLTVLAGLRACEVAGLTWSMVTTANNRIAPLLEVPDDIAKYGSGRRVPVHPALKQALQALGGPAIRSGPVIRSARGGAMRANSIVNFYRLLAIGCGLNGCSSHSGRRTFITHAARNAHRSGASLRDIQLLAGHRSIETTQGYIDGDSDAQRRLIKTLYR